MLAERTIYTVDTKGAERAVSALRNQFTRDVNRVSSELSAMREDAEQLEDQYEDESTELQMVDHKYTQLNKKYQEEKDVSFLFCAIDNEFQRISANAASCMVARLRDQKLSNGRRSWNRRKKLFRK